MELKCQQCGGEMAETKRTESSIAVQLVALVLFLVGVGLLFVFPVGTILGVVLILATPRMGYKRSKIWKCGSCGYFFDRA